MTDFYRNFFSLLAAACGVSVALWPDTSVESASLMTGIGLISLAIAVRFGG